MPHFIIVSSTLSTNPLQNYFAEDFVDKVEETIIKWGKFKCANVDLSTLNYDDLIKIERILIYDSKPVKSVFYIWQ